MAEALLATVISEHITRKNFLNLEITNLQDQRYLLTLSQNETQQALSTKKQDCRDYWRTQYESDESLQEAYGAYTDIPEFQEELERVTAELQAEIDELTAKEDPIERQITTDSAELEEIEAYLDSYKEMLSGNISEDYDFGLGG